MRVVSLIGLPLLLGGCLEQAFPATPPATAASQPEIAVRHSEAPSLPGGAGVRVLTGRDPGKPCEVVGVLDFHSDADSEDKGFELLRAKAESLGADTVVGAEFEHGHDGELSHLSGMAVRCGSSPQTSGTEPPKSSDDDGSWN